MDPLIEPVVPDQPAARRLWDEFRAATGEGGLEPGAVEAFGDSPAIAYQLPAVGASIEA